MDAVALIAEARAAGLTLDVDGDRLVVRGPRTAEPIVRRLREAKPDVLRALSDDALGMMTLDDTTSQYEFIRAREREISGKSRHHPSSAIDVSSVPPAWPAALPGLGARHVIAFSPCLDCETDPPADDVLKVGQYEIAVPGPRHTFVAFGDVPLCRRHARARAEAAR